MKYLLVILLLLYLVAVPFVEAKVLPRFKKQSFSRAAVSSFTLSPRLRGDRKAIIIYFNNLSTVTGVTYTLIYQTDGKDEGVSGSVDSSGGNTATREIYFGTCSSGVCREHGNITNMKLEVQGQLTDGRQVTKRYRIRP